MIIVILKVQFARKGVR